MRIWGPLALLVIFSLCVSATPETETPEPTTTAPTSAAPPTPPPKEDLSAYENVPPEIITVIQEYDDDGELDDNELKYVELLNNDPSLFEYSKTISDKNLENLNTYWSFHNKNPSIEDYKEYMFENPEEFENGAFMDEYDNNFSLSDLISLREMTGKDVASGILDKIGDEEYKDLVLDYIMGDFTIDSKDSFVAGNIKHGLFNAIFEDESVENYEDDLVERLSKNREIERFNLEPKGKLEIYKLLFNERDNDFYRTVYDNLFDLQNGRKAVSMRTDPVAFYLPGDIVRITQDGTQVYFLDLLEDTWDMRDKYYPHYPTNMECNKGGNKDAAWTDYLNALKNGTWCIKDWSFPWEETWFNATPVTKDDTVEVNWGCVLTPRIELHLDELENSEYYDSWFVGIPKDEPALVDSFWNFLPHEGFRKKANIYI